MNMPHQPLCHVAKARSSTCATRPTTTSKVAQLRRKRFFVLVRILLKRLERDDPEGYRRAKEVIRECTKKNREGAPDFLSLVDSIHKNLKTNVSASHWRHSEQYLDHFMKQKYEVGREITGRAA